jgi:hypothetical protein
LPQWRLAHPSAERAVLKQREATWQELPPRQDAAPPRPAKRRRHAWERWVRQQLEAGQPLARAEVQHPPKVWELRVPARQR